MDAISLIFFLLLEHSCIQYRAGINICYLLKTVASQFRAEIVLVKCVTSAASNISCDNSYFYLY